MFERISANVTIRTGASTARDPAPVTAEPLPAVEVKSVVSQDIYMQSLEQLGQSFDLCGQLDQSRMYLDRMSLRLPGEHLETAGVARGYWGPFSYGTSEPENAKQVRNYVMTLNVDTATRGEFWDIAFQIVFRTSDREQVKPLHQLAEQELQSGLDSSSVMQKVVDKAATSGVDCRVQISKQIKPATKQR